MKKGREGGKEGTRKGRMQRIRKGGRNWGEEVLQWNKELGQDIV